MGARPRPARGQSVTATRCALISTFALLGCIVAQGTLRAMFALAWAVLAIAAMGLEWRARRQLRPAAPRARRRR